MRRTMFWDMWMMLCPQNKNDFFSQNLFNQLVTGLPIYQNTPDLKEYTGIQMAKWWELRNTHAVI